MIKTVMFDLKYYMYNGGKDAYLKTSFILEKWRHLESHLLRLISPIRGRPFDSEGGGGAGTFGRDIYLFSSRARLENLFPGKPRAEYLFSTAINCKAKKKKKGGGGVSARV